MEQPVIQSRELHKFGGKSLANATCFKRTVNLIRSYSKKNDLIVVSAAGETTNHLLSWVKLLNKDGRLAHEEILWIRQFHTQLIHDLFRDSLAEKLLGVFYKELSEIVAVGEHPPLTASIQASVMAHGELWASRILKCCLEEQSIDCVELDARHVLRAERAALPKIKWNASQNLLQNELAKYQDKRIIITGFIAQNRKGHTVLLGRHGSDYSATMIGALAKVTKVTIWSEVAGVYSADPQYVPNACPLSLLRIDEASELARLATPVLHARTLQPVENSAIDLTLRSSLDPTMGSTHIERVLATGLGAKLVTSLEDVCVIKIRVKNNLDLEQIRDEIRDRLSESQLLPLTYEARPGIGLNYAYMSELAPSAFEFLQALDLPIEVTLHCHFSMIAAVGSGVGDNPHHTHAFYRQLKSQPVEFVSNGDNKISLIAVLRGDKTSTNLLETMHNHLFQVQKTVGIVLCGKGKIGSSWLNLFVKEQEKLNQRYNMSFNLIGVTDQKSYLCDFDGLVVKDLLTKYQQEAHPLDKNNWLDLFSQHHCDELVVIDVTGSPKLADQYEAIAEKGYYLISANKIAGSCETKQFDAIKNAFEKTGRFWLSNATVGGGLPINYAVQNLNLSGDKIHAISGIFSGTLSWLFLQYDGSIPFIHLLEQAWQQGLTESDPREDLTGTDVKRKLIILAREAGFNIEPKDVEVESLLPEEYLSVDLDTFFDDAQTLNAMMQERVTKAQENDLVLRYIARLDRNGHARVGLEALPKNHALAGVLPCDHLFAITSHWYRDNPLVIRGPGSGRKITAGAIQSDLNQLATRIS